MLFRWKIQCISIMYLATICPVMKCSYFAIFFYFLLCIKMNIKLRFIRYKINLFIKKDARKTESHLCTFLFHILLLSLLLLYIALIFCSCQQHLLQLNRVVQMYIVNIFMCSISSTIAMKMRHRGTTTT